MHKICEKNLELERFENCLRKKDKNKLAQVKINFKQASGRRNIFCSLMKMQTTLSDPLKFKQSWKVTSNNSYRL